MRSHGTMLVPTDSAAIFEWGLDDPFVPQDRPPLSIAMLTTLQNVRQYRRYRLVVVNRHKLRLSQRVEEDFFSVRRLLAFARSFNTFGCIVQKRLID